MRKVYIAAVLCFASLPALAQTNLGSQISAVNSAIGQQKADEAAEQAQREAAWRQQQLAQQQAAEQQGRIAAAQRARQQTRLDQEAAVQRAAAAKQEDYADQQRDLDLQERKLKLQAEQTRVNRENDMIDAKLKRENAQTDLVQSNADANRNVSEGSKSLLQDTGKAKVKEASSWFSK